MSTKMINGFSILHCLLDRLYSVNKPVVSCKNVTFIEEQNLNSNKEESIANQIYISAKKIVALEGNKLFVENKMEDCVC